ncbi:GDCCVxC domain-containing (seleno)protein [Motiliproteus sp.]|uniref:GDCCVxC domain-containing (seleno)protein n=1 Tax=Motiliproteus sp. TaxID=1898955 RepID=UPI003BA96F9C
MTTLILESTLTCPRCGHCQRLTMPTNACLFFHACSHCETLLKPLLGDCCVFCSYGDVPCPPIQQQQPCCASETTKR